MVHRGNITKNKTKLCHCPKTSFKATIPTRQSPLSEFEILFRNSVKKLINKGQPWWKKKGVKWPAVWLLN